MRTCLVALSFLSLLLVASPAPARTVLGLAPGTPLASMPGLESAACVVPAGEAGETCHRRSGVVLEGTKFQRIDYRFFRGKLHRFDARADVPPASGTSLRKLAEAACRTVAASLAVRPPPQNAGMRRVLEQAQIVEGMGAGPVLECKGQDASLAVSVELTQGQFTHRLRVQVEDRSVQPELERLRKDREAREKKNRPVDYLDDDEDW